MIPTWVDLARELTDVVDRDTKPADFVRDALRELAAIGVTGPRAVEAVAHCATECSWGRRAIGDNRGGVKLKEGDDAVHRAKHGHGLAWWRYAGHVEAGDAPVVLYRAFDDAGEFWRFFLKRYLPRDAPSGDRYAATGKAFWHGGERSWFVEMLLAGYRGEVRRREVRTIVDAGGDVTAHPSVRAWLDVTARVRALAAAP